MVKDFDLKTFPPYFSCIINGVRRSGKSRALDYIINQIFEYDNHKFDDCYLLSTTAKQQKGEVFNFVEDENIIEELDEDRLRKIFKEREDIAEYYKKNPDKFEQPPNCLIILDDILSDSKGKSLWHNKEINQLFFKGRHLRISLVVLTQYCKALSPLMRANADVLLYFRDLREDNRKVVLQEYLCFCNDREIQKKGEELMTEITSQRYNCMAVDRYTGQYANSYDQYVFKFKAPEKYDNNRVKFYDLPKMHLSFRDFNKEEDDKFLINHNLKHKKPTKEKRPLRRINI